MNWPPLLFDEPFSNPLEKVRHERRMREIREMDVKAWALESEESADKSGTDFGDLPGYLEEERSFELALRPDMHNKLREDAGMGAAPHCDDCWAVMEDGTCPVCGCEDAYEGGQLIDVEDRATEQHLDPESFFGGPNHTPLRFLPGQRDNQSEPELIADGQRLGVDFDNTLTTENVEYWNDERPEPDEDVIERVNEHYHAGGTVIVWTARPWSEASRIAAHLTEWGVRWHGIRCDKGSADVYLDDKAIRPEEVTD